MRGITVLLIAAALFHMASCGPKANASPALEGTPEVPTPTTTKADSPEPNRERTPAEAPAPSPSEPLEVQDSTNALPLQGPWTDLAAMCRDASVLAQANDEPACDPNSFTTRAVAAPYLGFAYRQSVDDDMNSLCIIAIKTAKGWFIEHVECDETNSLATIQETEVRELLFGGPPELIVHLERAYADGKSHAIRVCGLYGDKPWCAEREWEIGGIAKGGSEWQADLTADGNALEIRPRGPVPDAFKYSIGRHPINNFENR